MKEQLKLFLKRLGMYHSLQLAYRSLIFWTIKTKNRTRYRNQKGDRYTCNFCNAKYQNFVPDYPDKSIAAAIKNNNVIAGYGENVFCPNCMSKNRERLLLAVLKDCFDLNEKKILHFSPEKNLYDYLKIQATVTTVDKAPGFYKKIDSKVSYADATNLQFGDCSFDIVIANHILEHIPEDIKAMKEILRVLKRDGIAILQVPFSASIHATIEDPGINNPARQEELFGQRDHVRIYELKDFLFRTACAGFENEALSPWQLQRYQRFAIQEGEYVFLCHKRLNNQ